MGGHQLYALFCAISYKGLEHLWILDLGEVLEPISCRYWGVTVIKGFLGFFVISQKLMGRFFISWGLVPPIHVLFKGQLYIISIIKKEPFNLWNIRGNGKFYCPIQSCLWQATCENLVFSVKFKYHWCTTVLGFKPFPPLLYIIDLILDRFLCCVKLVVKCPSKQGWLNCYAN